MSTRLVILGLLRERPLYGYEIKHIIESHMGDWTSIAFGSIYFALNKLADEAFVEKIATEQEGSRPSRSVYQITDAGRGEFMRLLRKSWQEIERRYFTFDIALFFLDALSRDEAIGYMQGRVVQLDGALQYLSTHRAEEMADEDVPAQAIAIFDHSLVHLQAELAWTQDLLAQMERGEYP